MSDTMREKFDVWVNVYPPLPAKYHNAFANTLTAHQTREDALNNAGHSCLATCLLHFNGERLETAAQADARALVGELGGRLTHIVAFVEKYHNTNSARLPYATIHAKQALTKAKAFMEGKV